MSKKHILTEAHLKTFRKWVRHYCKQLGLTDWDIWVEWGGEHPERVSAEARDALAFVSLNTEGGKAAVCLVKDWDWVKPTDGELRASALHECLHILLAKLKEICEENPKLKHGDKEREEHAVINRLVNVMLEV